MRKFILSTVLLISLTAFSGSLFGATPFVEGKIILKNGDQKEGLLQFTSMTPVYAKTVKFKTDDSDKGVEILSNTIEYILVGDQDNPQVMRFLKTKRYTLKGGEKEFRKMGWCFVYNGCEDLQILKCVPFEFNKQGELLFLYDRTMMQEDYVAIRSNETVATFLGSIFNEKRLGVGGSKVNRKVLVKYFAKSKLLVSKIEKQKWDLLNLDDIVDHVCNDQSVDR